MLSTDANIAKEGSAVLGRMMDYGSVVEELHIIVATIGGTSKMRVIDTNVFAYPTASRTKIGSRLGLFFRGLNIRADIITSQDPFETGFIAWVLARLKNMKLELQVHTDFLNPYFLSESFLNHIRAWMARFLLPKAEGVRAVSNRVRVSFAEKKIRLKKPLEVLPIFIDVKSIRKTESTFSLREKFPQLDTIILMVSRLTKEKEINRAINIFSSLAKKYQKTGLIIVGNGPEKKNLESFVKKNLLYKSVFFLPWQYETMWLYKSADIFLLTSRYEGFGMSIVEAAASNLPILSTEVGVIGDLLKPEEDVLACPVGNEACLARQLERLIFDVPLRRKLAHNAQKSLDVLIIDKKEYLSRLRANWDRLLI